METDVRVLVDRLLEANRRYYDEGESDLSDDEYDALRFYLRDLGIDVSTLTPPPKGSDWPVQKHAEFMGKMNLCARDEYEWLKMYSSQNWTQGYISLKYDGLALELHYKNGTLMWAALRGDGNQGENVLANAIHIPSIPKSIQDCGFEEYTVRGELVISWNNMNVVNELLEVDGKRTYKSPRGAVAMIRRKDGVRRLLQYLTFKAYDSSNVRKLEDKIQILKNLGFETVDVDLVSPMEAWNRLTRVYKNRDKFKFQLDGIVYRDFPNGTYAKLKFPPESGVTTVTGVVEQLGRTGVVAPVVSFEPIWLVGAEVTKATGHNVELMAERLEGLGVGAKVLVTRRGDVIPHVESVVEPSDEPWTPTDECPSCGAEIVQEGKIRKCSADPSECPGTSMGLLVKYCRELNIDGFGPGVVSALSNIGVVVPAQLYTLEADILAEAVTPGGGRIGESIANKLCRNIWNRSTMTWGELLGAIGIPGCASSVMQSVADRFNDYDSLMDASIENLSTIDGIGPGRAAKIRTYLDTRRYDVLDPLLQIVNIRTTSGPLYGKAFCITLGLSAPRPIVEARIKSAGGTVKSSVSKKVDYVVTNEPDGGTSKLKRAQELKIPIIDEETLNKMIGTKLEYEQEEIAPDDDF